MFWVYLFWFFFYQQYFTINNESFPIGFVTTANRGFEKSYMIIFFFRDNYFRDKSIHIARYNERSFNETIGSSIFSNIYTYVRILHFNCLRLCSVAWLFDLEYSSSTCTCMFFTAFLYLKSMTKKVTIFSEKYPGFIILM